MKPPKKCSHYEILEPKYSQMTAQGRHECGSAMALLNSLGCPARSARLKYD